MKLSKSSKHIIFAYNKGYRVDDKGRAISPFRSKPLSLMTSTTGYLFFNCRNEENITYKVLVHRLVAFQKFGYDLFKDEIQVRHLDGNSKNNNNKNIDIGTASQNQLDKHKYLRIEVAMKAARANQDKIRGVSLRHLIYDDLHNNLPYPDIMKKHNVSSKGTLSYMKNKSKEYKDYISNL